MRVLGIETSCDETGIAIFCSENGLLAHALHSQVKVHAEYGGVVPELASRDHIRHCLPLIESAISDAGISKQEIDGIAYTKGPGLIGALLVGASLARSLAWALGVPSIGVHHMEGHLLAPMLESQAPAFPFLALLVSGGHTMLVNVTGLGEYQIMGESIDDAAGEAFDKTAKLLGLGYPGGPALAALATQGQQGRYQFPRPMTNRPGLDFSFSGLKTFAINTLQGSEQDQQSKADIALAFEDAVVDTMLIKCKRALKEVNHKRLIIAGGVGANQQLRSRLRDLMKQMGGEVFYPRPEFCTDNGAMIALVGCLRLQAGQAEGPGIDATARWSLESLTCLN